MSDQQDEEILRRRAREQAEIERQTDALVLRTLTSMVTASEELKAKLRLEAAKREREQMLAEVRAMEQRLRRLEEQIRSVFGHGIAGLGEPEDAAPAETPAEAPDALVPFVPASPDVLGPRAEASAAASPDAPGPDETQPLAEREVPVAEEPAPASPAEPTPQENHEERADAPVAPSPVASLLSGPRAPAPDRPARPVPFHVRAYTEQPVPARRRPVELVFDGVPGYQQASALERAVNDLLPNEDVDILQFDRGQLVLGLQAIDLEGLADQLVAGSPASLKLEAVGGDRATFRCT